MLTSLTLTRRAYLNFSWGLGAAIAKGHGQSVSLQEPGGKHLDLELATFLDISPQVRDYGMKGRWCHAALYLLLSFFSSQALVILIHRLHYMIYYYLLVLSTNCPLPRLEDRSEFCSSPMTYIFVGNVGEARSAGWRETRTGQDAKTSASRAVPHAGLIPLSGPIF